MNDYIQALCDAMASEFSYELERRCAIHKFIGTEDESPRWIQLQDVTENGLVFRSSAVPNIIFFDVPWPDSIQVGEKTYSNKEEFFSSSMYGDFYDYFKQLKYTYIDEHHPTINYGGTQ